MLQNSSVQIQYDYSIMLDTNYTSYIETFLKDFNKPNFSEGSIYKTLDTLLRNKFNYDYTYYLIENYKNLFSSGRKNSQYLTLVILHYTKTYIIWSYLKVLIIKNILIAIK